MAKLKVACSGSSGSGKTTMVKFIERDMRLKHISGSAGDIMNDGDRERLKQKLGFQTAGGHENVIKLSAHSPEYGILFQDISLQRRTEIILNNDNFVTDRSPADNLTYFINQCGFHSQVTDGVVEEFAARCLKAWQELTHVIYIKAVQPGEVENNGSRVANRWYQRSIDAQFDWWITWFNINCHEKCPKILVIDYWDINRRKAAIAKFLNS